MTNHGKKMESTASTEENGKGYGQVQKMPVHTRRLKRDKGAVKKYQDIHITYSFCSRKTRTTV